MLPRQFSHISNIIIELNESPMGGHDGYFRTFKSIARVLLLGGYKEGYKEFVMQCEIC